MSGIITISPKTLVLVVYDEFFFTLGRIRRHPLTQGLVADFEAFRSKIDAAFMEELGLVEKRHEADAGVEFIDLRLDGLTDAVATTTLIEAKNDRSAMPYALYFASQRPSDLRRPILGSQLETVRVWPPSLKASANEQLKKYGAELELVVEEADGCAKAQAAAHQAITDFKAVGTRKALIDEFNAKRKALHGKLGEIQHAHPELGTGWADSFFRQGSSAEKPSLRELDRKIAAAKEELASLENERAERIAQEEATAKAKAAEERAQKQAELDAKKKAAAELAARVAELEAELGE